MLAEKRKTLQPLLESSQGLHVTIYAVNRGDVTNLKEQLRLGIDAAEQYLKPVLGTWEMERFLKPLRSLVHDTQVLQSLKGNFGLFRNKDSFRILRIPVEVQEMLVVATSFHVKPLLKWLQFDRDFLLLGLERGVAHLYHGNQFSLRKIELPGSTLYKKYGHAPGFNSNASGERERALRFFEHFELLNSWLAEHSELKKAKVFVVGEKDLVQSARQKLRYPESLKPALLTKFNPHKLGDICFEIRRILKRELSLEMDDVYFEFNQALNSRIAKNNIKQIARAAAQGLVTKLIVADGIHLFGKLNSKTGSLSLHMNHLDHEDDDILDDLAQMVLAKGGDVIVASRDQIPQGHPALAILKYPGHESRQSLSCFPPWQQLQASM